MTVPFFHRLAWAASMLLLVAACGGDDGAEPTNGRRSDSFVAEIRDAVDAVESRLGGPQLYFEVTATPQLTNVFVAVEGGTVAVPYVYLDGELQAPGPELGGVEGATFSAAAIDFDESLILSGVAADLPDGTIDSFSVEGGPGGFVRYVVSVRSDNGGVLDIVVAPNGAIVEVNPL